MTCATRARACRSARAPASRPCSTTWATGRRRLPGPLRAPVPGGVGPPGDRLDRLHAEASVYRRPGGRPSGKAKGLVGDQALLVEVGRLELPGLVIRQRVREGWFEAGCGPVVAPPWPRGPIRSSSVQNRRSRATSHATAINRSLVAMGPMVRRPRRVGNPDPRFGHRSRDRPGRRDLLRSGSSGNPSRP